MRQKLSKSKSQMLFDSCAKTETLHFLKQNSIFLGDFVDQNLDPFLQGKFITLHKARELYLEGIGRHKNFTQI